jgi:hypothetical protein
MAGVGSCQGLRKRVELKLMVKCRRSRSFCPIRSFRQPIRAARELSNRSAADVGLDF